MATIAIVNPVFGPDICWFVPPNIEANKPVIMAQYIPALAPAPDVTPKAKAKGSATMVEVSAPKISPLMV